MYSSDESKIRYAKSDFVKNAVTNYLHKRNYAAFQPTDISKSELHLYSSVDNEIGNPNSIRYRCYNCDPVIIDNNFSKFLTWLKEPIGDQISTEMEQLIGPLFCHLYLDILQGGHPEKAAAFLLSHLPTVEKANKDSYIQDLMSSLSVENGSDYLKEEFRSNKYVLKLSEDSKTRLMNFISQNCHVIFLQELQTWFEIEVMNSQISESETNLIPNECCLNSKFQKILNAAADLESDGNKLVYSIDVSNVISEINCGSINRQLGLFAYNQGNMVHIHPIHSFNNLVSTQDSKMIKLNGHSTKVYAITTSRNYLASASSDGKICIYKNKEFELVEECLGHIRTVYCLKISSNELYLASGSEENTIRLWNVSNGKFLRIFIGHEQAIFCLDFHPNSLYLISGSSDKSIRMWNIETANSMRLLHGCQGTVRDVACHPLGQYLVSASDDKYLRTWDILTGKIILETKCKDASLRRLQWNKSGILLCGAFSDKTIIIWNYKNFDKSVSKNLDVLQIVDCPGIILALEYCFGTFGVLTTRCIPQT